MRMHDSGPGRTRVAALVVGLLLGAVSVAHAEQPPRPPLHELHGRVLDHTGKPVDGASVAVAHTTKGHIGYSDVDSLYAYGEDRRVMLLFKRRNGLGSGKATTDADGQFVIKGLRKGKFNLLAAHAQHGVGIYRDIMQPNAGSPVEVRLAPPTFVEGTITGLPAEGPNLIEGLDFSLPLYGDMDYAGRLPWLRDDDDDPNIRFRPWVVLDEHDKFRVGPLPAAGTWNLTFGQYVQERRYEAPVLSVPIHAKAGKTTKVTIDRSDGKEVAGVATGPDNKPLPWTSVSVEREDAMGGTHLYGAVTNAKGEYKIAGVPDGLYRLRAFRHAIRTAPG